MSRCGWSGTVNAFLAMNEDSILKSLIMFIPDASEEQILAWSDSFNFLVSILERLKREVICTNWSLIFEYELPREGGRRPDVLLLLPGRIIVLEFKMKNSLLAADTEQLTGYLRDLRGYHSTVHEYYLHVTGAIVLTKAEDNKAVPMVKKKFYKISGQGGLYNFLVVSGKKNSGEHVMSNQFLNGRYEPLPTILEAARLIMKDEKLPNIRRVNNTNIPTIIEEIKQVVRAAKNSNTHHLVLVTGVPGSGKTLVGLQLAHTEQDSIYLSGNGPLVDVIQDSLNDRTLVQALLNYKREFLKHGNVPPEHIIIFDEAQRAWDSEKMQKSFSEPDLIIELALKEKSWSVVVGLIGEGQEIHEGEESGLDLWNQAIRNGQWMVHSSDRLHGQFPYAQEHYIKPAFNLTQTLRSHASLDWHQWVEHLFQGNLEAAKELSSTLLSSGMNLYVTRNIEYANQLARDIYKDTDKQFGYLVSSKGFKKDSLPILKNRAEYVPYFNDPESKYFSSKMNYFATEFQTQGLELDLGILLWGYDLRYEDKHWRLYQGHNVLKNPFQIRLNSYRVLLTRGRDGTIIVIPNDPVFDSTYELFVSLGIPLLK